MHSETGEQHHSYSPKHGQIYALGAPMTDPTRGYAPDIGAHFASSQLLGLPKVGQTRCYWALLSPELTFIYFDPVLANHLQEQAPLLVGASLLSFVHPDEQASARADLGGVIEGRALHGSVTRVRFARLSKVQSRMAERDIPLQWADADKIAIDSAYMAVDITINWIADGLVLCFLHAATSLGPQDDDPIHRTGWSNWCGTPFFAPNQVQLVVDRLHARAPPSNLGPPTRVFQILANVHGRPLIMSWPPATESIARDLAALAEDIDVSTTVVSEAKTSCTRRRTKVRIVPTLGAEVESVYIPHGSIIFACHKIDGYPINQDINHHQHIQQRMNDHQQHQMPPSDYGYYPQPHHAQYDPYHNQQPQLYVPSHQFGPVSSQWQQQPPWMAYPPQQQIPGWSQSASPVSPHSSSQRLPYESSSPPRWQTQVPSHHPGLQSILTEHHNHVQQLPANLPSPTPALVATTSPSNQQPSTAVHSSIPLAPPSSTQPPSETTADDLSPTIFSPRVRSNSAVSATRPPAHRPLGILKCTSCQTTQSPEWRKGPSGKKELCNACGLRFARSRAKEDGTSVTMGRKRKEKAAKSKKAPNSSPSSSPTLSSSPEDSGRSATLSEPRSSNGTAFPHINGYASSYDPQTPTQEHRSNHLQGVDTYDESSHDQYEHQHSQLKQYHDEQ